MKFTGCNYCFRYAITEFLLENKINKHAVSHSGITPMAIAVEHLNPAMVRILIKYGYNMNKVCTFIMCFVFVLVWDNKSQQHHLPSFGFGEPDLYLWFETPEVWTPIQNLCEFLNSCISSCDYRMEKHLSIFCRACHWKPNEQIMCSDENRYYHVNCI